jgi:plasmid rolling circle replication initiator protein Rep
LILEDFTSAGKLRPWQLRQEQTIGAVAAYRHLEGSVHVDAEWRAEFGRIAGLMEQCGKVLKFACATDMKTEDQQRRLKSANFCRGRLCPNCNWRRSQKLGNELHQVARAYQADHPKEKMIMLTLTERNCSGAELGQVIDLMSKAFSKLRKRNEFVRAVRATFRSVEISVPRPGEYHPHIHVLLFVDEGYFDTSLDLYVPQEKWAKLWKACRVLDYVPVVDVRRMKNVSEVTKYVTKASDYMCEDETGWSADPFTIRDLHIALKKRRLIAWSRELQSVRQRLGCSDDELGEDETAGFPEGYIVTHYEVYRWQEVTAKRGFYVRTAVLPPKDDADADDEPETG